MRAAGRIAWALGALLAVTGLVVLMLLVMEGDAPALGERVDLGTPGVTMTPDPAGPAPGTQQPSSTTQPRDLVVSPRTQAPVRQPVVTCDDDDDDDDDCDDDRGDEDDDDDD